MATRERSVAVIIPVRESETLHTCLSAVTQQDYDQRLITVIVVDNNAAPAIDWVQDRFPAVVVLREDVPGSYRARNLGLSAARADVIAFTDADCVPSRAWLTESVKAITAGHPVSGGAVEMFPRDGRRLTPIEAYEVVHGLPQKKYVADGWALTANLVTTSDVMLRVGPFSPTLQSGGDAEWGHRATRDGFAPWYNNRAVVRHPARRTFQQYWAKLRRVHLGAAQKKALAGQQTRRYPAASELVPHVRAYRRAQRSGQIHGLRNMAAFVIGDAYVQYAGLLARYLAARQTRGARPPQRIGVRRA